MNEARHTSKIHHHTLREKAGRFPPRCELDTAYVMDTLPIVRKHDEKAHGEYRTKRVIPEAFDRLPNLSESSIGSDPHNSKD